MVIEKAPNAGEIWIAKNADGSRRYCLVLKNFGIHVSYLSMMVSNENTNGLELDGVGWHRYVDPTRVGYRYFDGLENCIGILQGKQFRRVLTAIQNIYRPEAI